MKYRAEIDGLRAVAVIPVILFHAGFENFSGGFVGVDVFFVISGYLITTIILSEMEQGTFSLVNFYERRARRILPALFLVMLVSLPFAWLWLLPSDMKDFSRSLIAVPLFSSNILFWQETGYWGVENELKPLLHTWSLAVEEQYYILFPLFLMLMWRFRKRWILGSFITIAAISLVLSQWAAYNTPVANFFLLPTRGWELAIGAGIAFYFLYRKQVIRTLLSHKSVDEALGLAGLLMIVYSVYSFDETVPFPGFYALIPTIGTGLIILFSSPQTLVGRLLGTKLLVGIGLISYSAYLWHQPLLAFSRHSSLTEPSQFTLATMAALSFPLAYLNWRYIEKPFRAKGTFSRKQIFSYSIIGSLAFITIGLFADLNQGDFGRYGDGVTEYFKLQKKSNEYVWDLKNKLRNASFDNSKTKILIIGDSNSGDLLNALFLSDTDRKFSFSSLTIDTGCGNLYLPRKTFKHLIKTEHVKICSHVDDLMLEKNRNLISQADWVFFASSWHEWESERFSESYEKLLAEFGDKFWVFGNKHLDFFPKKYIRSHRSSLFPSLVQLRKDKARINAELRLIAKDRFIDPYELFCNVRGCKMISERGDLIVYDGFHLTKFGATYFGKKLEKYLQKLLLHS